MRIDKYILVVLCITTCNLYAQNNGEQTTPKTEHQFGIEASLNYDSYLGVGNSFFIAQNNGIIGGDAGVYWKISYGGKFTLQPEMLLSVKGGSSVIYTNDYPYQSSYAFSSAVTETDRMFYFDIPLQIQYAINKKFFIQGGAYFGVLLCDIYSRQESVTNNGITTNYPAHSYFYSLTNEIGSDIIELGVDLGIGIKLKNNFNLALKFSRGSYYSFSPAPLKNIIAGFSAEYSLNKKSSK